MCGAENRDVANYCLMCGSSVVIPPLQAPNKSFCCFHPQVMAQVYCSECGAPICFTCARYGVQSVFCPICHQRRFHSTMGPIAFEPKPWITYPMIPTVRQQRGYFG
ncbi:MAG: B-box zinc finger protein [Candidatus Bathyarchaeia archaeon]